MRTMFKIRKMGWLAGFCAALLMAALTPAYADKTNLEPLGLNVVDETVNVMLGKAEVVDLTGPVSDVMVANPSIVDVTAIHANRMYVVGASLGDTNIIALDEQGNIVKRLNVHVQMDTSKLEATLRELYPSEDVKVRSLTDQVVLTGSVSTPSVASQIVQLVGHYAGEIQEMDNPVDEIIVNMLEVRGEQQVMLRVKIVEASRSALKDLGVETDITGGNFGAVVADVATAAAMGLSAPAQLGIMSLTYGAGGFGPVDVLARALEEEGIVNTLAEPNLTAISGEQAGFLAGGEFPIPTERDEDGNLVYEFRPFGVSLNFRPVVLSENRISMQLNTEVSTFSFDNDLELNGVSVPTFNVRRADTTVELPSGGTLMIAGLLQSDTTAGLTQVPGVKNVPVIGDLMKSDTFNRDESELVVMVTPYLVQPFADSTQSQPTPKEPMREENKLTKVFGDNIRRTYGKRTPEGVITQSGTFGYITD